VAEALSIELAELLLNISEIMGFAEASSMSSALTNWSAFPVKLTVTSAPIRLSSRAIDGDLIAAIDPVTPSNMRFP
jgi:hypothetical protein